MGPATKRHAAVDLEYLRYCSHEEEVVPHGYTKEQWAASVKRVKQRFYMTVYGKWKNKVATGMDEMEAKNEASKEAAKARADANHDARDIRREALEADAVKAESANMTVDEWLTKWSEDLARSRASAAARKTVSLSDECCSLN